MPPKRKELSWHDIALAAVRALPIAVALLLGADLVVTDGRLCVAARDQVREAKQSVWWFKPPPPPPPLRYRGT